MFYLSIGYCVKCHVCGGQVVDFDSNRHTVGLNDIAGYPICRMCHVAHQYLIGSVEDYPVLPTEEDLAGRIMLIRQYRHHWDAPEWHLRLERFDIYYERQLIEARAAAYWTNSDISYSTLCLARSVLSVESERFMRYEVDCDISADQPENWLGRIHPIRPKRWKDVFRKRSQSVQMFYDSDYFVQAGSSKRFPTEDGPGQMNGDHETFLWKPEWDSGIMPVRFDGRMLHVLPVLSAAERNISVFGLTGIKADRIIPEYIQNWSILHKKDRNWRFYPQQFEYVMKQDQDAYRHRLPWWVADGYKYPAVDIVKWRDAKKNPLAF